MAAYDGNGFSERGAGGGQNFPVHGGVAVFDVRRQPGGGVNVYRITRRAPAPLTLPAQGTKAELDTLIGLVGTSRDLVYVGGTVDAFLAAVDGPEQVVDGLDLWRWSLSFLIDWTDGGAIFPTPAAIALEGGAGVLLTEDGGRIALEGELT